MDLIEVRGDTLTRHPWEVARAACLLALVADGDFTTVADIGAGDLYFAREFLKQHPGRLIAVDKGYEHVAELDGILLRKSLSDVADNSLDLAFLMDVLEHVQDDRGVLEEALRKFKPRGVSSSPSQPTSSCSQPMTSCWAIADDTTEANSMICCAGSTSSSFSHSISSHPSSDKMPSGAARKVPALHL